MAVWKLVIGQCFLSRDWIERQMASLGDVELSPSLRVAGSMAMFNELLKRESHAEALEIVQECIVIKRNEDVKKAGNAMTPG